MKVIIRGCCCIYALSLTLLLVSCKTTEREPESPEAKLNVLIFSKTNGFRHESIDQGGISMKEYFTTHNISFTHSEDSSVFNSNALNAFDVVMFFNTTGNILDSMQQDAFVTYIKSGKGFVGIHSASDTEYDWPWYAGLVGVQFANHPQIQQAAVVKVDTQFAANKHLPERWTRTDEWYNFKQLPSNVNVLLTLDETTYQGGEHDSIHPISWYHNYDGGRSFYTAMGHTVESYHDTMFLRHVMEAVLWAGGK